MNEQTQITFNAVQGRLTDLELQLLSTQSQVDLLTQEIEKLKGENAELQKEITELKEENNNAQSQIDLLTQEIEKLKKENEDLKGENSNA